MRAEGHFVNFERTVGFEEGVKAERSDVNPQRMFHKDQFYKSFKGLAGVNKSFWATTVTVTYHF